MKEDGTLVVYNEDNKALWASSTSGNGTGPYKATLQADSDFVVNDSSAAIWAANTKDKGRDHVTIQPDGNFVIMYTRDGNTVWCTRTNGGQGSPVVGVGGVC